MILVTGAAGKTGKAVIKALSATGASVRALVRRAEQAAALKELGAAEIKLGSFEDDRALTLAAVGARAIYHICPNVSRDELAFARAVAAAARATGVERLVYHSVLHPQIEAMPHHWEKMRVEEMLLAADLKLTILQPTAYMQNILGAWRGIIGDGVFRIPYPVATRLSLVDLNDVAEAAALVLTTDGHDGATYELVGTRPLSQLEIAAAIGAALERKIRAEEETIEAWDARMRAAGMGEHERVTLAAMFGYYAHHGLAGNPNTLAWLLGRTPHDLAHFLDRIRLSVGKYDNAVNS
ncbi:MAG TPA: NmrA family NAD(P)-binding protein [Xanthobacteraceae bacterium]|nr:NmrA family NAD(P)-binding protein [Xanthobacteraceae bacterium]